MFRASRAAIIASPKIGRLLQPAASPSIVVLPFTNPSSDPADEYFAEGLADELTDALIINPYDPEGLYYYGQTMEAVGTQDLARELYARAVEADRTAPQHRKRFTAKWSRLAQKRLGKL